MVRFHVGNLLVAACCLVILACGLGSVNAGAAGPQTYFVDAGRETAYEQLCFMPAKSSCQCGPGCDCGPDCTCCTHLVRFDDPKPAPKTLTEDDVRAIVRSEVGAIIKSAVKDAVKEALAPAPIAAPVVTTTWTTAPVSACATGNCGAATIGACAPASSVVTYVQADGTTVSVSADTGGATRVGPLRRLFQRFRSRRGGCG